MVAHIIPLLEMSVGVPRLCKSRKGVGLKPLMLCNILVGHLIDHPITEEYFETIQARKNIKPHTPKDIPEKLSEYLKSFV